MPRGGARTGSAGVAYPNRSDLNSSLPAVAAPGQPYGAAGAQVASQQQMPMAPPSAAGAAGVPGGAGAPPSVLPGQLGVLHRPSERPGEPVTSGVPSGPGPGPGPQVSSVQTLGGLLSGLAQAPGATQEVRGLSAFVNRGRV